jgi:hypothetical protein
MYIKESGLSDPLHVCQLASEGRHDGGEGGDDDTATPVGGACVRGEK